MTKNIWFDLTNSMTWEYARMVGLIRVELEVAAALVRLRPDVRFSMFRDGRFVALSATDVPWLYSEEDNVGSLYLKSRWMPEQVKNASKEMQYLEALDRAMPNRGLRLQYALDLIRNDNSVPAKPLVNALLWPLSVGIKTLAWVVGIKNERKWDFSKFLAEKLQQPSSQRTKTENDDILKRMKWDCPFKDGDTVISFGWYGSGKEHGFVEAKARINFRLVYFIYDLVLANEHTKHLYPDDIVENFENYLSWASSNCDCLLYGGKSVKIDAEAYQKKNGLPSPPNRLTYYGASELAVDGGIDKDGEILRRLGVTRDFILSVGSIECKKNQEVLYKALVLMSEAGFTPLPQLVIAGGHPLYQTTIDFLDTVKRDPRVEGTLIIAKEPSDEELDTLYRNCRFTALPSAYEGWSVIVQESFKHSKFCLASDVPPLREVGGELADYVPTFDPAAWAAKIDYYISNPDELAACERKITRDWVPMTWMDVGGQVLDALDYFDKAEKKLAPRVNLWYDLSATYLFWQGRIEGVIRTELILAYHLHKIFPTMRFFGFWGPHFMEITKDRLDWLFNFSDLSESYSMFQDYYRDLERQGKPNPKIDWSHLLLNMGALNINDEADKLENTVNTESISSEEGWRKAVSIVLSVLPEGWKQKTLSKDRLRGIVNRAAGDTEPADDSCSRYNAAIQQFIESQLTKEGMELPFGPGDVVFSAGINCNVSALLEIIRSKKKMNFIYSPIIYDLTPQLFPQLHVPQFVKRYETFFYLTSLAADAIIYGGETAKRDGVAWQKKKGWPQPPGLALKFGADLASKAPHRKEASSHDIKSDELKMLENLGVHGEFLLSVGTLQARKNHEVLYRAYVELMEAGYERLPQMVFVGNAGWKAKGLFEMIERDKRVEGKILLRRVTDAELDALYRNCRFTLLPSLYEGWSLTLPESLGYGKFCLTAAVDPLMETGRDLVEYVEPWNVAQWAEKIKFYCDNDQALRNREVRIKIEWHPITWVDCAQDLADKLQQLRVNSSPISLSKTEVAT